MTLGYVFDPRLNALNAWRLVLASGVFFGHSFALTGKEDMIPAALGQLTGHVWVDGFFAISGFLVTGSWLRTPRLASYVAARLLRLLPGLWVCLLVTGLVIAPIAAAVQGGPGILGTFGPVRYFLMNFTTVTLQQDINGTPRDVAYPEMWNGSLWTLQFEMLCYLAVATFGLLGLLTRRWFIASVTLASAVWSAVLPPWTLEEPVSIAQILARFTLMFFAGALLHQFRDVVPARWTLVAACAIIVVGAGLLPNYRLLAALPLAYLLITSGALIRTPRLTFRNDLSYGVYIYAWPLQQLLVICGLSSLHPLAFFGVVAVPIAIMAAASWFVLEKRALRLKVRVKQRYSSRRAENEPAVTLQDDGALPGGNAPGAGGP